MSHDRRPKFNFNKREQDFKVISIWYLLAGNSSRTEAMNCLAGVSSDDESVDDWEDFVSLSSRHGDSSITICIKQSSRSDITTWYVVDYSTKMERVFNSYGRIKGIDARSLKFNFLGYEILPNDTVESIGIVEKDIIECYNGDEDNSYMTYSSNKRRRVSIICHQFPRFNNGKYVDTMKQVIRGTTGDAGIDTHAQGLINMYSDKIDGLLNELPFLLNFISSIFLDILTSTGDNSSFHAEHMTRQLIFRLVVGETRCKFDERTHPGTYMTVITTTVGKFKDYVRKLSSDELADHPKGASLIHIILDKIEHYPDELPFSRLYIYDTLGWGVLRIKDETETQCQFFQLMRGLVGEPFRIQISQYEHHNKVLAWKLQALVATLIVAFSNRTSKNSCVKYCRQIRLTCRDGSGFKVEHINIPTTWLDFSEGGIRRDGQKTMTQSYSRSRCSKDEGEKKTVTALGAKAGQKRKHKYKCSAEGCTNRAQNGGVCRRHGAKVKRCSSEGCKNQVVQGGVCTKHGAKKYRYGCKHEGCTKLAQKGGLCRRHGGKKEVKRCSSEGCTNQVVKRGMCWRHGANGYEESISSRESCFDEWHA